MSNPNAGNAADPFFIGWLPMPAAYRRFLAPLVITLLFLAGITGGTLAFLQQAPGPGHWDTDNVRTFDGLVYAGPYATLLVPGDPPRTFLLVEEGKFGALPRIEEVLQGAASQAVRVSGTVLHRDGRWMLELAPGEKGLRLLSAEEQGRLPALVRPTPEVLAERITLKGEIIDPKCYLGAMKPGGGKTHKACATLCVGGGVPPMLVTRDADKVETFYLLTTADGGSANDEALPWVGDVVEISGRLEKHGDVLVVKMVGGPRRL